MFDRFCSSSILRFTGRWTPLSRKAEAAFHLSSLASPRPILVPLNELRLHSVQVGWMASLTHSLRDANIGHNLSFFWDF